MNTQTTTTDPAASFYAQFAQPERAHQVMEIASQFHGQKDVKSKTIEALEAAGFEVSTSVTMWNFGTSGTLKADKAGNMLLQIGCATGGKARNGRGVNACEVYKIS